MALSRPTFALCSAAATENEWDRHGGHPSLIDGKCRANHEPFASRDFKARRCFVPSTAGRRVRPHSQRLRPRGIESRINIRTYRTHIDVRVVKYYDPAMVVKPSRLRANLYRLLDHVLRTGEPIEIDRGGKKLLIVPKKKQAKLNNLVRRDIIAGDPEDLVHLDWSKEWRGDLP
jgi:hypothetical protein